MKCWGMPPSSWAYHLFTRHRMYELCLHADSVISLCGAEFPHSYFSIDFIDHVPVKALQCKHCVNTLLIQGVAGDL